MMIENYSGGINMDLGFNIVKKRLTLKESVNFINKVVRTFFDYDDNGDIIGFTPYLGRIQLKIEFLKYYTDFKFSDNPEKDFEGICGFQIKDCYGKIDFIQFAEMDNAIQDKVNTLKEIYVENQNGFSKLMNELTSTVQSLNIPEFDFAELNKFMKKFDESGLNAQELVNTYLQSDEYKSAKEKELNEVIDSKNEVITAMKNQMKNEVVKELIDEFKIVKGAHDKVVQMKV